MKPWLVRGLLIAAAAGIAFWLWTVFFPSPEKVIRKRLQEVEQLASFESNEGALAKVANTSKLGGYFTPDVTISVNVQELPVGAVHGRSQVVQAADLARSRFPAMRVELLDVSIEVGGDKTSAMVETTGKVRVPGQSDLMVQELKITFRKLDGDWLIERVETVRTLRLGGTP